MLPPASLPCRSGPALGADFPDVHSAGPGYAKRFGGDIGAFFLTRQWEVIEHALRTNKISAGSVLDVGGGHGQLAPRFVAADWKVTVVGSPTASTEQLNSQLDRSDFEYVTSSLPSLPFPNRSFDLVTATRMLAHVPCVSDFLSEVCRVARRAVIVDYPVTGVVHRLAAMALRLKQKLEPDTRPYRCLHRSEVEALFAQHQFAIAAQTGQFLWPMALHRLARQRYLADILEAIPRRCGWAARWGSPIIALATPTEKAQPI